MKRYVATFHTHLAALRSSRRPEREGHSGADDARCRGSCSSSCGTCVRYVSETPKLEVLDRDTEAVYEDRAGEYTEVYRAET